MIVKLDEKDAALSIGSTAFEVVVSCEVSGIYTASQEGKMSLHRMRTCKTFLLKPLSTRRILPVR